VPSGTAAEATTPGAGTVSGTGGVLGAAFPVTFGLAKTHESVNISSRCSPKNRHVNTDGQLAIRGNAMRGSVTESLGCASVRVSQITRDLVMQRKQLRGLTCRCSRRAARDKRGPVRGVVEAARGWSRAFGGEKGRKTKTEPRGPTLARVRP